MKKTGFVLVLALVIFFIWLFNEKPEQLQAQYGSENLKNIYTWSSGYHTLDGANAATALYFPFKLSDSYGGFGSAFGSFTLWVNVEDLKAGTAADSLQIWYKEMKNYTSSSSYTVSTWDSTLVGTYDWTVTANQWKKYTIVPDVCLGLRFYVKHTTVVDDSIKVKLEVMYQ